VRFLLINPPVYDFACYDLWMRPYAFLRLATLLRTLGEVYYLDSLDRGEEGVGEREDSFGCGKFRKTLLPPPPLLREINRPYFRYGMEEEEVERRLEDFPSPDFVFINTGMTYWYPGVREMVNRVKRHFPSSPVILGGIYATIIPEHARSIPGVDMVFRGKEEELIKFLAHLTGRRIIPPRPFIPSLDLLKRRDSFALFTSYGCPFRCSYCASFLFHSSFGFRRLEDLLEELDYYQDKGVEHIAILDDAFLYQADKHALPFLEALQKRRYSFTFHTPNALHARFLTLRIAELLKENNFLTLRLGLETAQEELMRSTGDKVRKQDFEQALGFLKEAGYPLSQVGVYIMLGLPGSGKKELKESILYVHSLGARVILANYSPIPHTPMWRDILRMGILEEDSDPLWHNNTIFPLRLGWSLEEIREMRDWVKELNEKL